jgi:hypothetical protein
LRPVGRKARQLSTAATPGRLGLRSRSPTYAGDRALQLISDPPAHDRQFWKSVGSRTAWPPSPPPTPSRTLLPASWSSCAMSASSRSDSRDLRDGAAATCARPWSPVPRSLLKHAFQQGQRLVDRHQFGLTESLLEHLRQPLRTTRASSPRLCATFLGQEDQQPSRVVRIDLAWDQTMIAQRCQTLGDRVRPDPLRTRQMTCRRWFRSTRVAPTPTPAERSTRLLPMRLAACAATDSRKSQPLRQNR